MNEPTWLASLSRAKATEKQDFLAIHVAAELRGVDGVAPVILQTAEGYQRAPSQMEAAFELCLRHLHGRVTPLAGSGITPQALLANRAMEALRLPGRYIPTPAGQVTDMATVTATNESMAEPPASKPPIPMEAAIPREAPPELHEAAGKPHDEETVDEACKDEGAADEPSQDEESMGSVAEPSKDEDGNEDGPGGEPDRTSGWRERRRLKRAERRRAKKKRR